MVFLTSSLLSIALLCFPRVNGQTTQTVQVGLQGSFFDPSYVVAQVGDVISFVFSGNLHSVTQSTYEDPCLALPGGFNSGLAGKGPNGTLPVPVWNLKITNASGPIWYFCQGIVPKSHCNAGMVGVINPPNITAFTLFQSSARLVSGTPTPTFSVTLSGVGAIATASPSDLSTLPPVISSTTSSSSIAPATTTVVVPATNSGDNSNASAIVGGTVGGVLGLLLILVALFWVLQQRKARKRSGILPHGDFPYVPKQPTHNLEFAAVRSTEASSLTRPEMEEAISRSSTLSPLRHGSPPQNYIPGHLGRQSFDSGGFSHTRTLSEPPSNINIQSLAQEVAVVLRQNPGLAGAGGQLSYTHSGVGSSSNVDGDSSGSRPQEGRHLEFHIQNRDDREPDRGPGVASPGPPHYRATVGPSGERLLPREP